VTSALKTVAGGSSEMLIFIYNITRRHIPENYEEEWLFYSQDGGNKYLKTFSTCVPDYKALDSRR
jgi:hypothetical protein